MTNKIPTQKEFKRICHIAKDNASLAKTLDALYNAWVLCDPEYNSTYSEKSATDALIKDLSDKLIAARKKHEELQDKIYDLDNPHLMATPPIHIPTKKQIVNSKTRQQKTMEVLHKKMVEEAAKKYMDILEYPNFDDEGDFGK